MNKEFQFNDSGVCTNPNKPISEGGYPKPWGFEVRTAQIPSGMWVFGLSYTYSTGGGGHGAWLDSENNFANEKEAIHACLVKLKRLFESQISWYSHGADIDPDGTRKSTHVKSCEDAIKIINEQLQPRMVQLELF